MDNTDRQAVPVQQQQCLATLGSLEELMVNGFPFEVPKEFSSYPLLKGRATVEVKVILSYESQTSEKFTCVASL